MLAIIIIAFCSIEAGEDVFFFFFVCGAWIQLAVAQLAQEPFKMSCGDQMCVAFGHISLDTV